jgi:RHS repeat-associated protein
LYTSDVLGRKTWSAYDGLNRVVRTVTNASGSATDGSAHDPRSSSYSAVQIPDQDLISSTVYDLNGYVMYTVDPLGRKTWTGYDGRGRQIRTVVNALGSATDGGSNDPTSSRYIPNIATDVDVVSQTVYDAQGRVAATIDPQGNRTQFIYDSLGRRTQTVVNFVTGVPNAAVPDQDLINSSVYDIAGRVTTSIDPRGMKTTSTYDRAGRRLTTTQAAGSGQAITSYTCYDKGGRVLRTIQNWVNDPRQPSPDARDANGNWLFNNPFQGNNHDRNLITSYSLDRAGRQVAVIDAIGNQTQMAYAKDGQLISMTDPMGVISTYRYDLLRRRTLTVQNYVTTNRLGVALADPQTWTWNKTSQIWQDGKKTFIHDGNVADPTDQNLIAQVTYDKAGRTLSQRDPKGQVTSYSYNLLNQRTQLIDSSPTPQTWKTDYRLVGNGTTQTKLTDPVGNVVQQTTDRLGRLSLLQYPAESAPKPTPDITFSYDRLGNRLAMSENNGVGTVRRTTYAYDRARRLSAVVLDVHGDGSLLQQVGYQYDPGGLRRQLTLPDGKTVSYQYNTRRQLTNMTDWAGQSTGYGYDGLGRLGAAFRPNGLMSQYSYDAASRLLTLRHSANGHTLASFNYTVDARGNRTQVLESMAGAGTPGTTTLAANDSSINYYRGNWTVNGSLMTSVDSSAALRVPFFGTQATLTMGTGSDHSVFDIYLDGDLWQSGDGYAATTGTQTFSLTLNTDGPHALEVRNRPERNLGNTTQPAVYRLDMSGLSFIGQPAVVRTTVYTYDGVSRLRTADSFAGLNSGGTALQHYAYNYDLDGNRTQAVAPAGTTNFTYDSANHLLTSQLGAGPVVNYTYDHAGRLTNDGTNTYTWDGADRLLSVGSTSYLYNGMGQRMQQTGTSTVTQYVLDTQPGLAKVLQSTTGSNITRYVHGPMGIQEQQNSDATWRHPIQDGLGSVRTVVDTSNTPQESRWYDPYGTEIQQSGSQQTAFGFTGEETDWDGLVNLRARYYNPALGQFMSLDPLEGASCTPMSLNRYMYVQGNIVNQRDPRGLCGQPTNWLDPFDANCYYSADGLARRFSNGDQSRYNSLFSILIQLPWGDLKDIEATGTLASIAMGARRTLDNASIIPGLAQQNFGATVQAFMQYITCPSNSPDQRTLGLLGLGITAYGRLTQIVGEFISKNLNIFAIASVGARVLSGSVGVAPSTLGTVSAAGTTGVVSAFAGSIAGGVSTGYGFASVWDSIRNAADNILYGPSVTQFAWQAGEKRKVVDSSQQPHNCTPPVESEWEDTIHTACDMPEMLYSCDGVIDRNLIPEIMANIELCLTYRKNFAEKCFDNTYDPGHDKEMADRENAWKNCQRKLRYLQNK